MSSRPDDAAPARRPAMTPVRRATLWGFGCGAALGALRLAAETPHVGDPGGPQTVPGLFAMFVGYALPWALVGAGIGYLAGRRKPGTNPASALSDSQLLIAPLPAPAKAVSAPAPTTALQRLGHVLGWTGNIIAAPAVCLGVYGFTQASGDPFVKGVTLAFGIAAFLLGRALRYIFAGPTR